jgi:membrane protein YdbS with pleckstrin-like domain
VTGFPARFLNPGEQVEVDLRPHWKFLAGPVCWAVLALAGSVFALVAGAPRWGQLALGGALLLCLLWLVARWLRWATTSFVVTSQRLIVRKGVLGRTGREILIDRLTDVTCRQSLLDRLLRCGDVLVESPGRDSPEMFPDLPRPLEVQSLLTRLISTRTASAWPVQPVLGVASPQSVAEHLAQLDDLRRRGLISKREFAAKKAELLSRM